jgi:hypothetical protein
LPEHFILQAFTYISHIHQKQDLAELVIQPEDSAPCCQTEINQEYQRIYRHIADIQTGQAQKLTPSRQCVESFFLRKRTGECIIVKQSSIPFPGQGESTPAAENVLFNELNGPEPGKCSV